MTLRLALAGLSALSLGIAIVIASLAQGSIGPAFADTSAYELYCPGTPVGNIALNDVVTTGTITPASPAVGSQFNLTNYQSTVLLPSAIVGAAAALGNSAIVGSATLKVDATGATPASVAAPLITIDAPIPSPVPDSGLSLVLPSTPGTVGPFTATGGAVTLTVDPAVSLGLVVSGSTLNLTCTPYRNNAAPTGIVASAPTAPKVSPVIATSTSSGGGTTSTTFSGSTTTIPPTMLTGAYELYCPGTPVGNVVLNDAVTSATLSPLSPTPGQSFSVTGYQTVVNLPAVLAGAAAALGPNLTGSATTQIDASGATPATAPQGPFNFNVAIPSPVPDDGVPLSLPSTPGTVAGFTATSGAITIQQDSSAALSLTVAGSALTLSCTAYPNNSVVPSGITTTTPDTNPIAPVIASAGGGGTTTTTATTGGTTTTTSPPTQLTGAYELFCPGTPVGNVVLNDAVTSATLSPVAPTSGQSFSVTGYQTVVNLPAALAGAAAALSPTLTGSATTQIDASGATPAATPQGPFTFNVAIPSPVPDAGVPLSLPDSPSTVAGFTATNGPITIQQDSAASLSLEVAGSALTLTCMSYPNNTVVPSGITTSTPTVNPIAPVIAAASGGSTTTTTGPPATTTSTTTSTTTTEGSSSTTTSAPQSSTTTSPTAAVTTSTSPVTSSTSPPTTKPPTTAATTAATTQPPRTAGSGGSSTTQAITTSSSSLAFTGPGPGLKTATLVGTILILLGLLTLALIDTPRRMIHELATLTPAWRQDRRAGGGRTNARKETAASPGGAPADWYGDPLDVGLRYWDGKRWTEHVAYQDHTSAWSRSQPDDREGD